MDKATLLKIMPHAAKDADTYLPILERLMPLYGIDSKRRQAHFLAQLAVESGELQYTQENLNYSATRLLKVFPRYFKTLKFANEYDHKPVLLANRVYANRMGNGDEQSGDGYRFRGRGLIQLTGRDNYAKYFEHLSTIKNVAGDNLDIEAKTLLESYHPDRRDALSLYSEQELCDLIAQPEHAVRSACWYWREHGLNQIADSTADEVTVMVITRRINGGTNGLVDRKKYYYRAKALL